MGLTIRTEGDRFQLELGVSPDGEEAHRLGDGLPLTQGDGRGGAWLAVKEVPV